MDIFRDIASVTRRIEQIAGQNPAPPAPAIAGGGAASFSTVLSSAMQSAPDPSAAAPVEQLVNANAGRYGVDPALVKAIIANESGFDPNATSKTGAQGLMQLEPQTASSLGVTDAYDPRQNIWGGTRYIRNLLDRFHGDLPLAVAAYNAGPEAVERYGGIPPYAETQNYVQNVLASYQKYKTS